MKRISAKIDTYQDESGNTKGKYVDIGVIMSNDNGEYVLLNPTIDLAGVLMRQRMLAPDKASKSVLASVFDQRPPQQQQAPAPAAPAPEFDDGDIPF